MSEKENASGAQVPCISLLDALRAIESSFNRRMKEVMAKVPDGLISGEYYRSCVARAQHLSDSADAIHDAIKSLTSNNRSSVSGPAAGTE